jgi:hypothetical protein
MSDPIIDDYSARPNMFSNEIRVSAPAITPLNIFPTAPAPNSGYVDTGATPSPAINIPSFSQRTQYVPEQPMARMMLFSIPEPNTSPPDNTAGLRDPTVFYNGDTRIFELAGSSGGSGTLADVLSNGNSAGIYNIDMSGNSIENVNTIFSSTGTDIDIVGDANISMTTVNGEIGLVGTDILIKKTNALAMARMLAASEGFEEFTPFDAPPATYLDSYLDIESEDNIKINSTGVVDVYGTSMNVYTEIDMSGNKITNLATPTDPTDAATKAYVDASGGSASNWATFPAVQTVDMSGYKLDNVATIDAQDISNANIIINTPDVLSSGVGGIANLLIIGGDNRTDISNAGVSINTRKAISGGGNGETIGQYSAVGLTSTGVQRIFGQVATTADSIVNGNEMGKISLFTRRGGGFVPYVVCDGSNNTVIMERGITLGGAADRGIEECAFIGNTGPIDISSSGIGASINLLTSGDITLSSGDDINITASDILTLRATGVIDISGNANINMTTDNNINITSTANDILLSASSGEISVIGDDVNIESTGITSVLNINSLFGTLITSVGAIDITAGGTTAINSTGNVSIGSLGTTSIENFNLNNSVLTKVGATADLQLNNIATITNNVAQIDISSTLVNITAPVDINIPVGGAPHIELIATNTGATGINEQVFRDAILTANDVIHQKSYFGDSSTGAKREFARDVVTCRDPTNGAEDASLTTSLMRAGTLRQYERIDGLNNNIFYGLNAGLNVDASGGTNVIAIGAEAGQNALTQTVSIGDRAGQAGARAHAVSIGTQAGASGMGIRAVAIGNLAGQTNLGENSVAVGYRAGQTGNGYGTVAIGDNAANTGQGNYGVAIGTNAGQTNQQAGAFAFGIDAGQTTQGAVAIAIGGGSGRTTQGARCVAIGENAGNSNQQSYAVTIGAESGKTTQGTRAIAIGENAGNATQGQNSIAIGRGAGLTSLGNQAIAIGHDSIVSSVNLTANAIALGHEAVRTDGRANAIGIGHRANHTTAGTHSIMIGSYSTNVSGSGTNSIAIGRDAVANSSTNNSITLNGTGVAITANQAGLFVAPIRGVAHGIGVGVLKYDTTTFEITYSTT